MGGLGDSWGLLFSIGGHIFNDFGFNFGGGSAAEVGSVKYAEYANTGSISVTHYYPMQGAANCAELRSFRRGCMALLVSENNVWKQAHAYDWSSYAYFVL